MNFNPLPQSREGAHDWLRNFANFYNWTRPHEALDFEVPGSIYSPSPRSRPLRVPIHEPMGRGLWKKVDARGHVCYKGRRRFVGKGLIGQHIEMIDEEGGFGLFYAGIRFGHLSLADV